MKQVQISTLALFLLVFASCQKESSESLPNATDVATTSRSHEVPFKAFYETTVQTIGFDDGVLTLNIDGNGKASHLGKSTMHSISTVNTNVFPWIQTGPQELTAANGDKLFGSYAGIAIPNQDGSVIFEGTWEITHGTGRFEGVTGSGSYKGSSVPADGVGEISYEGTLKGL